MEYILNELLVGYLNDGIISVNEMKALVALREFVNRVATSNYIEPAEIERIRNEFETEPRSSSAGSLPLEASSARWRDDFTYPGTS